MEQPVFSFNEAVRHLDSVFISEDTDPFFVFELPPAGTMVPPNFEQALFALPAVTCATADERTQDDHQISKAADIVLTGSEPAGNSPWVATANLEAEIDLLKKNISQSSIASMTLVQLLRMGPRLSVRDQLIAESLAYSTLQSGDIFKNWLKLRSKKAKRKERNKHKKQNSSPAVLVHRTENQLELTLNKTEKHNAYSAEMRDILTEALRTAYVDETITEIQLKANGAAFCSGGDLDEFGTTPNPAFAHKIRSERSVSWWLHLLKDKVKVEVHGACIGAGIELPAFTNKVTAQSDAFFQLPEIGLGLVPGAGGTSSIPRRIGRQKTAWLALSQKRLDLNTALSWGLVDELAD